MVPGGVIAVGPDPEPFAAGSMALGGEPMRTDAIFRIQSMTKLVTTVAALRLVAEGTLALDTPVASWLPELAAPRVLPALMLRSRRRSPRAPRSRCAICSPTPRGTA